MEIQITSRNVNTLHNFETHKVVHLKSFDIKFTVNVVSANNKHIRIHHIHYTQSLYKYYLIFIEDEIFC